MPGTAGVGTLLDNCDQHDSKDRTPRVSYDRAHEGAAKPCLACNRSAMYNQHRHGTWPVLYDEGATIHVQTLEGHLVQHLAVAGACDLQ